MKIYAIRDILLDYFMVPFAAPGDKEVMSAVAIQVNRVEENNAVSQAPQHFELWELAILDEEGRITPTRALVCSLNSLVRGSVRKEPANQPGDTANRQAHSRSQRAPERIGADTDAEDRPPANKTPPDALAYARASGRLD